MPYGPMMDRGLFLIRSLILDVKGVRDSSFTDPYNAIISVICDYVGTYVGVLIELCLPRVFKQDNVSLLIHVIYSITILTFVAFINKVLFSFPDHFPVYVMTSICY